jgi:cholesterol transport system auxiliary component
MMKVLAFLPMLLASCVDLKGAPAAERRFYALSAERPGPSKEGGAGVLKIRRFQISRAYEGVEFVYRASESLYESDFYHAFFTPPASQVTEAARKWMSTSGLFAHVIDAASVAPETHLLEGHVAALYADLRAKPLAVVELQLTLLTSAGEIRLHRSRKREVEAASSEPDALIAAWCRGIAEILAAAEIELATCIR